MEDQEIPLGHLLSTLTGFPFSVTGPRGMLSFLRYMAQYPIPDGVIAPAVWALARHSVLRQHPWIQTVQLPYQYMNQRGQSVKIWCWLDLMERRWGDAHVTSPASPADWKVFGFPRPPMYTDDNDQPIRVAFQDPVVRFV